MGKKANPFLPCFAPPLSKVRSHPVTHTQRARAAATCCHIQQRLGRGSLPSRETPRSLGNLHPPEVGGTAQLCRRSSTAAADTSLTTATTKFKSAETSAYVRGG